MDTNTSSVSYPDNDLASSAGEKISSAASQAKNKVADLGRTAAQKIENNRQAAADKLSATAEYVRQNDVNTMLSDVERLVRKNPGPALLGAAAIGFLVGRAFSDND